MAVFMKSLTLTFTLLICALFVCISCSSGCPSGQKSENGVCVPANKAEPPSKNHGIDGDLNGADGDNSLLPDGDENSTPDGDADETSGETDDDVTDSEIETGESVETPETEDVSEAAEE